MFCLYEEERKRNDYDSKSVFSSRQVSHIPTERREAFAISDTNASPAYPQSGSGCEEEYRYYSETFDDSHDEGTKCPHVPLKLCSAEWGEN